MTEKSTLHNRTELKPGRVREEWYENGQIRMREVYRNECSEYKFWFENGMLGIHEFYRYGRLEGERKHWYESGGPCLQRFYRDGKLEGEDRYWTQEFLTNCRFNKNGFIVIMDFTPEKKRSFLRIKHFLHSSHNFLLNSFLITDLQNMMIF